ncbi:retrotransposon nucleocapsid protein [Gigaspora margarita]|uniref:Retrotransposon nucleocapsid protein n=1 Tax=Gigaspora margarita TaxID=4874 RepID=A0A8H4AS54_GIGMA|nr:retrotransposon nucleocapsid protein [Gigaspora margarita]
MVKLPKIPDTPEDFNDMVNYLQQGIFAEKYNSTLKKSNFQRRCKNFVYDQQTSYLFFKQPSNDNSTPIKKRVVLTYDFDYVLTLIDIFSRYVWAISLKDKEGNTIHGELVNIFKNFGPPTKLQADNRSEFITR